MDGIGEEYAQPVWRDEAEYYRALTDQVAVMEEQRLTWNAKKYLVRNPDMTPEYVWQDHFRPHRRAAVEAFGLSNHSNHAFDWTP